MKLEIVKEKDRYIIKSTKSYATLKRLVMAMGKYGIPERGEFAISAKLLMEDKSLK